MTDKCYDIGTIQAFLDGELASEQTEAIARHVSTCDGCAVLLAEAEEESAFAFSALEQEFNTLVPTQRLWAKINDSIEREKKSFWKPIFVLLRQPSKAAFASLIFVAVVSITLLNLKPDEPALIATRNDAKIQNLIPVASTNITKNDSTSSVASPALPLNPPLKRGANFANYNQNKEEIRPVKASAVKIESKAQNSNTPVVTPDAVRTTAGENVVGEESYIKTIASLTETVNERKDQTLTASSRFAFERDLAVTNDAIKKMKKEVQKNPNNEAAKQILRASYQNKIDLLSSVADKNELMASLK